MCLTSELEMGCMVPCSRMGEEKEEEEAQLAEEGIKEQVSLERKESKLSFPFFLPLSAHASSFKDAFCSWSSASQHQSLKQVLCVQFKFNLRSSPVRLIYFPIYSFIYLFQC